MTTLTPSGGTYYISYVDFQNITGQTSTEASESEFNTHVPAAEAKLNRDTGKTSTSKWTSVSEVWSLVQRAEAYLTCHYIKKSRYGVMPDESLDDDLAKGEVKSDTFLAEYNNLVNDVNGTSRHVAWVNLPMLKRVECA